MTARAPIGAAWCGFSYALCVLASLCTVNASVFARSSNVEAPGAALADAAASSTDAPPKGTGFAVPRHVIAGGGGRSTGAVFAITGTIGQADADPLQPSTGGVFAITGGFWPGIAPAPPMGDPLFANGFEPSVP